MTINTELCEAQHYVLRSCLNCDFWERCNFGKLRPDGFVCDYGKYGCKKYQGEYNHEQRKPKRKKRKRRKKIPKK